MTLSKAAAVSKVPAGPPAAVTLSKEPAVSKVPAGPPAVTLSEPAVSEVPAGPPQAVAKASSFNSAWRYCQALPDSPVAPSPKAACKTPEKKRASSAEPGSGSSPKGGIPAPLHPKAPHPKSSPEFCFGASRRAQSDRKGVVTSSTRPTTGPRVCYAVGYCTSKPILALNQSCSSSLLWSELAPSRAALCSIVELRLPSLNTYP